MFPVVIRSKVVRVSEGERALEVGRERRGESRGASHPGHASWRLNGLRVLLKTQVKGGAVRPYRSCGVSLPGAAARVQVGFYKVGRRKERS